MTALRTWRWRLLLVVGPSNEEPCGGGRASESWQATEWTVGGVEAEREHGRVVLVTDVHASSPGERAQLAHVADRHRHVALGAADRKVVLVAVLPRLPGKVELDAGERELERDATVVDGALALDGQRRRRHRHAQVHGREPSIWRSAASRSHRPTGRSLANWSSPQRPLKSSLYLSGS